MAGVVGAGERDSQRERSLVGGIGIKIRIKIRIKITIMTKIKGKTGLIVGQALGIRGTQRACPAVAPRCSLSS
jgi:hypothetical protein